MTEQKHNPESGQQGVEGLTEVLRLQAEALSRISERMSETHGFGSGSAIPPPEAHEPRRDAAHLPVLAGDAALNEDSLPVLNSFKKFLDQERQESRKRLMWTLLGFAAVFTAVLAVIVWFNGEKSNQMEADVRQTRQEADAGMKRLAEQSALTATQNVNQMRRDLARNILWAHSLITSNVNDELSGRDSEVERLKDKISAIEIENAMLSRQVMDMEERLKQVETSLKDSQEEAALEAQIRAQDAAATNRKASAETTSPLTINSAKFNRTFKLRMPKE